MKTPQPPEEPLDRRTVKNVMALAASYADDGEPLESLYADLDRVLSSTWNVADKDEMFRLASLTWADAFLTRLNRLTCADPVTGLSSVHHLATYLTGIYRQSTGNSDLALIVIDVVNRRDASHIHAEVPFGRVRLAVVADTLDKRFEGSNTMRAAVSAARVALLVDWTTDTPALAVDLAATVTRALRLAPDGHFARTEVVRLPGDLAEALALIEALGSATA